MNSRGQPPSGSMRMATLAGLDCDWRILFDFCMAEAHAEIAIAERVDLVKALAPPTEAEREQAEHGQRPAAGSHDLGVRADFDDGSDGARTPVPDSEIGGEC